MNGVAKMTQWHIAKMTQWHITDGWHYKLISRVH